jgi:uncharacterized protein
MKIQVGGLADGIYTYTLSEDASTLELRDQFQDQITANVTVEKIGSQVLLSAQLAALGSFQCDRCLTPFLLPLAPSYRMHYLPEGSEKSSIDPSELQIVPPGFSVIDMSEDVRQTVLLSIPLKLLCMENCKGLCPHCGTNLNGENCTCEETSADERWEELVKLKKAPVQRKE